MAPVAVERSKLNKTLAWEHGAAQNVAEVAREKGISTLTKFFGAGVARELSTGGQSADLIVANNVLAHVPDLNDFVDGLNVLLKPHGIKIGRAHV